MFQLILHNFWTDGARELGLSSKDASFHAVSRYACFYFRFFCFKLAWRDEGQVRLFWTNSYNSRCKMLFSVCVCVFEKEQYLISSHLILKLKDESLRSSHYVCVCVCMCCCVCMCVRVCVCVWVAPLIITTPSFRLCKMRTCAGAHFRGFEK